MITFDELQAKVPPISFGWAVALGVTLVCIDQLFLMPFYAWFSHLPWLLCKFEILVCSVLFAILQTVWIVAFLYFGYSLLVCIEQERAS